MGDAVETAADTSRTRESTVNATVLHRTCACGQHGVVGDKCESCRSGSGGALMRSLAGAAPRIGHSSPGVGSARRIFSGVTVSSPDDAVEREADRVADEVLSMPDPEKRVHEAQGVTEPERDLRREVDTRAQNEHVDQEDSPEDEDELRLKVEGGATDLGVDDDVDEDLGAELDRSRGSGEPLAAGLRSFFEPRFGQDLGHVRVHADADAGSMARRVHAEAFAQGSHLYFAPGRYAPGAASGQRLLAHELAHTVQPPGTSSSVLGRVQRQAASVLENRAVGGTDDVLQESENGTEAALESKAPDPAADQAATTSETAPRPSSGDGLVASRLDEPQPRLRQDELDTSDTPRDVQEPRTNSGREAAFSEESGAGTASEAGIGATELDATSGGALLQSLSTVLPSEFGDAVADTGQQTSNLYARQRADLTASLPEIDRPTGLAARGQPQVPDTTSPPLSAPTVESPSPGRREGSPPSVETTEPAAPLPAAMVATRAEEPTDEGSSWWDWLSDAVSRFLGRLPTSDPAIDTSAGERPRVDTTGDADPARNTQGLEVSNGAIRTSRVEADEAADTDFGENDIYPAARPGALRPATTPGAPPEAPTGVRQSISAPDVVRTGADRSTAGWLQDQVGERIEQEAADRADLEHDSAAERIETQRLIARETTTVRAEQETVQSDAHTTVTEGREQWRQENREIQMRFGEQAEERRAEVDRQVDNKIRAEEGKAEDALAEAETKAQEKKLETERKAEEKKREQENRPSDFWSSLRGAVSDFFASLKEAVNALFDALRKFVRETIDRAKRVVRSLIEAARNAVVGLIRGFGMFLKGIVTVALAAYPGAADRARHFVDDQVDSAVEKINQAADALQEFAQAALDALGAGLDAVLSVYQRAYALLIDGLRLLAVGLIDILERIGYLVAAVGEMPGHLFGQATEELVGQDLTAPLPFERTEAPEPKAAVAAAVEAGTVSAEDATALTRTSVPDSAVSVDGVVPLELDPELVASLALQDGENREFGENGDPTRTMAAIQREQIEGAVVPEMAGQGPKPGPEEGAGPETELSAEPTDPTAAADEAPRETSEQETERRLQMLMAQPATSECPKEASNQQVDHSRYPENEKFGPLTVVQRSRYLLHQMIKGITSWFACNWPWLLAAAVGLLTAGIVLTILTGGAITAAIPPLMELVAVVMLGVALGRVVAYVAEYLAKGWAGEIVPAGRSLARGLAIAAIELVFTLLFDLNAVIKAAKRGVVGTLRAGVRSTARAGRQLARSGRGVVRGLARAVRRPGRAAALVGRVTLRRGRLALQGLRRGFAKGARSINDLARRLWHTVRFRRFKLVRRGRRLQLWGLINPWVLLADGSIIEALEHELPAAAQAGDAFMLPTGGGRTQKALLITRGDDVLAGGRAMAEQAASKVLTPGKEFAEHFKEHRHLLGGIAGRKFGVDPAGHAEFLDEMRRMMMAGELRPTGLGSVRKGGDLVYVFEGSFKRVLGDGRVRPEGLTMLMKPDGEWVTLLQSGVGMAATIKNHLRYTF